MKQSWIELSMACKYYMTFLILAFLQTTKSISDLIHKKLPKMEKWRNGDGEMEKWRNGEMEMEKWRNGEMEMDGWMGG
jgi:hypothetical protein